MRSTNQIIIAVSESQPCTDKELRLCIMSLKAMLYMAEHTANELADFVLDKDRRAEFKAHFWKHDAEARFQGKKMPLDKRLGPGNTPGTPEYERHMKWSKAVFKKATGLDLDN